MGLVGETCTMNLVGSGCPKKMGPSLDNSYKIYDWLAPTYLSDHIPWRNEVTFNLRNRTENSQLIRTVRYENCFFPYTIKAWKDLSENAKSKSSLQSFKKYLNDFIRPLGHSLFGTRDKFRIKLLTKIRVSFLDLRDHRFNHNFSITAASTSRLTVSGSCLIWLRKHWNCRARMPKAFSTTRLALDSL